MPAAARNMARYGRYGRWMVTILFLLAYGLLAHYTNIDSNSHTLGTAVALAPIVLGVLVMAWSSRHRKFMLMLAAAGFGALLVAWSRLEQHYPWIYWAEHAGTQALLFLAFKRTLSEGREPMCSFFARMVHGSLPPPMVRYTRQITVAWTVFFGLMASVSTVLFFAAPLPIWSAFVNFFTGPLIVLMFLAEYAARHYLFPDFKHVHFLDTVDAVRRNYGEHAPK